ncbi:MAG: hypothetical protein Hyperionvirus20_15 [Hyperionvirus sp.]|uniref:Uncharacterized protein n=1 Tax=Hyperionvirus sp. TaxID=2487770 RepID=A0A3G5AAI9_9VIRU|nr:MAG: hypothetical protein Hyperionvirus20_15 [Hyperionvirus sp.]
MPKQTIGIIDTNDIKYDEMDMTHSNFTHEKISEILSDYIQLKQIETNDEMMETIINELCGEDNELPIHTATVSQPPNNIIYQMCHIAPLSKEIYLKLSSSQKYNGIASYLSDVNMRIYGKAIIFKINTTDNTLLSITENEITDLLTRKFVHEGVIINTNGTFDTIKYIFNPVDWIPPSDISNYKYHEVEILNLVFMIFHNLTSNESSNDAANKLLNGTATIQGRVIVGTREAHTDISDLITKYVDLDIPTIQKVIQLCSDNTQSRTLTDSEDINNQLDPEGKRRHLNFHQILSKRLS